jgi:porin
MRTRITTGAGAVFDLAPRYGKWLLALGCALAALPRVGSAAGLDPAAAEDEPAVSVAALYVGDVWRNTTGGLRTGSAYLGNANVSVSVDGARALGLDGTTFYVDAQSIHGQGVSSRLVGDAQTLSNIEAQSQLRLYELWMERSFGARAGDGSLRFGLYDLNSEFDSLESAHLFLNASSGVGPTLAQSGLNGPSIFPVTALGGRVQWAFSPAWSARVALFDGVPGDPNHPTLNRLRFGGEDGLLAISEVGYAGAKLHKLAVGAWGYTGKFDEIVPASGAMGTSGAIVGGAAGAGNATAAANDAAAASYGPAPAAAPAQLHGNRGFYLIADGQLFAEEADSAQGLSAFMRLGSANDRINRFRDFAGAGLVYTGALPSRPEDKLGLAISSLGNGSTYRRAQLADGFATDRRETNVELSYRFGVTQWLTLQTSIQHVTNPDTNPDLHDAIAVGLRFELTQGWSWPPSSRRRWR